MKPTKIVEFAPLRGLPGSVQNERDVLGVVLSWPDSFYEVQEAIKAEDFELQAHQVIYRRMCSITEGGGSPDRTAVATELQEHGELEQVGGISYLIGALEVPHLTLARRLKAIRRDSLRRQFIRHTNAAMAAMAEVGDYEQVMADHCHQVTELIADWAGDVGFVTPQQVIEAAGGIQGFIEQQRVSGLETPWAGLNRLIGGLKPQHLFVVAALTSRGKTAFALNLAEYVARRGTGVAIFSQEMAADELTQRFVALKSGISWRGIQRGLTESEQRQKVSAAAAGMGGIWIDSQDTITVPAMGGRLRKLCGKESVGLVIVDYLQLVSGAGKFDSRANEVSSISRGLKRMAKEFRLPVVALSQLNREPSKGDREPELKDLRESGSIEQDANEVLFLHFTVPWDTQNPFGQLVALLKKQRGGPIGSIPMQFYSRTGLFTEIDTGRAEDEENQS